MARGAEMSGPVAPFSIAERDPGPMARLEDVKRDEGAAQEVGRLLCDGMTLFQIARQWGVPKHLFADWFLAEHGEVFERAQRALGSEDMHEVVAIADGEGDVARDRLKCDVRFKRASKFDRKRYGEEADAVKVTPVTIQIANLRGEVAVVVPALAAKEEI